MTRHARPSRTGLPPSFKAVSKLAAAVSLNDGVRPRLPQLDFFGSDTKPDLRYLSLPQAEARVTAIMAAAAVADQVAAVEAAALVVEVEAAAVAAGCRS